MDHRRLLTAPTALVLVAMLAGCASFGREQDSAPGPQAVEAVPPPPPPPAPLVTSMAPIPNPPEPGSQPGAEGPSAVPTAPAGTAAEETGAIAAAEPRLPEPPARPLRRRASRSGKQVEPASSGRAAIAEANAQARIASAADAFEGGVQVFGWEPGRLYEVWTAPLRVTTLTLAPGETVTAKAAGDTIRWQIGETTSGSGAAQRSHVLVKPLETGLETNLVLTTSQRVYMLLLRSGAGDGFNAAVAWRYPDAPPPTASTEPAGALASSPLEPERLDDAYRIEPRTGLVSRRPRWTPASVFNDGARTFITLPPEVAVDEAPVLFVLSPDGEAQVVNYRQQGAMLVVDRLFDRAELRLGDKRPQVVRISRVTPRGGR